MERTNAKCCRPIAKYRYRHIVPAVIEIWRSDYESALIDISIFFPGSQLALVVGVLHKIIVYAMEYEEAERRTNSVETRVSIPIFFFSFSLSFSLFSLSYVRAREINPILITCASLQERWMFREKSVRNSAFFNFTFKYQIRQGC